MIQNNYFSDNEDLVTAFESLVDWDRVVEAYEDNFADAARFKETGDERYSFAPASVRDAKEYYRTILNSFGELTGKELAPIAQTIDQIGLKFDNGKVTFPEPMVAVYEKFQEAGLLPFRIRRDHGGLGLPETVVALAYEILTRGDTSFAMTLGLQNLGSIIERYGKKEHMPVVEEIARGNMMGAMALTEPNYGSDLRNIQTRAEKQKDGSYRITGTKRFISQGCGFKDRDAAILTLARTGKPGSGARGLSFFLVKSGDVRIEKIEHKLGILCSPTCEIVYDNSYAELIGEEGLGLTKYGMGMMNGARISVGSQGVGIGTAAYFESLKYAREREQFGKPIIEIPAVRKILDRMEREVSAMRLLHIEAGLAVDMYLHRTDRLEKQGVSDREIRANETLRSWDRLATLFTPMAKFYNSEMGCVLASDALQIHGGSGYTEEYDVARIFRDSRINPVYEGTTQLQVVAAIGGVTAGMAPTGYFRQYIEAELGKYAPSPAISKLYEMFNAALEDYKTITDEVKKDTVAYEMVEIGVRFFNSLLMDRSRDRLTGDAREKRKALSDAYNVDSYALLCANHEKIKAAARGPLWFTV
ncbi:MAG: acyl-CoA dehydrogenase family protein [Spirochaetales bacterium]|nr:acyl-CoA dehydrogenase family protein [Spirochaetales bacterium]